MSLSSVVIMSISIAFIMFFIWLCIISIRLSIAYKALSKLYVNQEKVEETREKNSIMEDSSIESVSMEPQQEKITLPPLSIKQISPYIPKRIPTAPTRV